MGLLQISSFDILSQQAELAYRVFSKELWALIRIFGKELKDWPPWELDELFTCFLALKPKLRCVYSPAVFIDGLDELDEDHEHLVRFITELNSWPGVKILVQ